MNIVERMAYSSYGLPRYVIAILHIMEAHKDCLKWTVSERSHKLSLTLTWDFKCRDGKKEKTFWGKLQKTLKGTASSGSSTKSNSSETSEIPMNLIRFIKRLEMETKEEDRQQGAPPRMNNQQTSELQKQQRWSRYSLQSLPNRTQSISQNQLARLNDQGTNNRNPQASSQHAKHRHNAMKSYASYHHLSSKDLLSPYHSSWPEDSFEGSSDQLNERFLPPEVVLASGGPSAKRPTSNIPPRFINYPSNKQIITRNPHFQANKYVYRSNEKVNASTNGDKNFEMNDSSGPTKGPRKSAPRHGSNTKIKTNISAKQGIPSRTDHRRSASACSNAISRGGHRYNDHSNPSIGNNAAFAGQNELEVKLIKPSSIVSRGKMPYLMPHSATDVTSESDTISDVPSEEDGQRKHTVNQTVIRCLDSCDKILYRHSTTIT